MRTELIRDGRKTVDIRKGFEVFYNNKFFNKWMKKFNLGGMDYQEAYFIMKKFWFEGTIACSERINMPEETKGILPSYVFTPWVMANRYNPYDFPTHARCINIRAVNYISNEILEVDKEIVIGWCQANHKGIYSLIAPKLAQLVDLEMVIRICTKNQKAPWIIATSPEDKKAVDKFIEDLNGDEPVLITMLNDLKNAKSLASAAPFILDKLEAQRQKIEDDIKTLLGVANVGIAQKKEHFTDDEVQTNNSEIEETSEEYLDEIKAFFERCNKTFGTPFTIELSYEIEQPKEEEQGEEDYEKD